MKLNEGRKSMDKYEWMECIGCLFSVILLILASSLGATLMLWVMAIIWCLIF